MHTPFLPGGVCVKELEEDFPCYTDRGMACLLDYSSFSNAMIYQINYGISMPSEENGVKVHSRKYLYHRKRLGALDFQL